MSLNAKDVEEIMKLLDGSRFDRLSLEMDGIKLELERGGVSARPRPAGVATSAPAVPTPEPSASAPPSAAPKARQSRETGLVEVKSPLLGVFYRAPKPGEAAFVEVGSQIEEDAMIGIVEVMKLMNSVRAGVKGEVVEILAVNGELVEHGEALLLVRPAP